jgi:hypothetical protein
MVERIMKISSKDKLFDKGTTMQKLLVVPALGLLLAGCNPADGTATSVASNDGFSLYCPNVGIAADQCILSDPENPYAGETVDDTTKYTFANAAANARDKFYVWATAQANSQSGENQYYTALSLQQLYDANANASAQAQAKLAYKSVLDNYFDSSAGDPAPGIAISNTDLLWDTDFNASNWDTGATFDTVTTDPNFKNALQVTDANPDSWGTAIAFYNIAAGELAKYENLVFKLKDFAFSNIFVKFPGAATEEVSFDLATYSTSIAGSEDWSQVTIPLSSFGSLASSDTVGIHTGYPNHDTFMITDIGFTGDATGNGLSGDDGDGFVAIYHPGTNYSGDVRSTEFTYGDGTGYQYTVDTWGTGTTLNHNVTTDPDYSQVYSVQGSGESWGSTVAFVNFDAGFAAPYTNLVVKFKDLTDNTIKIKFAGGGTDNEVEFNVATQGEAISGTDGWYQMTIPIASNFLGASGNFEFAMFSDTNDTWYFTDLGFTGDATGNGMTGDTVGDGMVTLYKSDTVEFASGKYRDLVGENLVEPASLDNLYDDAAAAETALSGWGFSYDTATNTLTAD